MSNNYSFIKKQILRVRNGSLYFLDCLLTPVYSVVKSKREEYHSQYSKQLRNESFTIIGNNCTAGIMYHDLQCQFLSPTINLWLSNEDFFEFLNNLEYYTKAVPEETNIDGITYPVGKIRREDREITIYFMHYLNFEEACQKWRERSTRINMDNLYVVFNCPEYVDEKSIWLDEFNRLDYKNKIMLTNCKSNVESKVVRHMHVYDKFNHPGVILEYKSRFSSRRWLDDFDYVSFLNQRN